MKIDNIKVTSTPQYKHSTIHVHIFTDKGEIHYRGTLSNRMLHVTFARGDVTPTIEEGDMIQSVIRDYFNNKTKDSK